MKRKSTFVAALFSVTFLLTSCEEQAKDTTVEIGKEFKMDEAPLTILKLEESKVLRHPKDETVKVAPAGKKFLYFEVKNPKNETVFLSVFNKENEIKVAEDLYSYLHEIDGGFTDNYFVVDENVTIDKIEVSRPGDVKYIVLNPAITKSKFIISEEAQKIAASYNEEKAIGLLQGFAPFIKDGKSVFDVAKQEGSVIASNVMSKKAEVIYFTEDGKKYVFEVTDILGGTSKVTTLWENGKITALEVVEY